MCTKTFRINMASILKEILTSQSSIENIPGPTVIKLFESENKLKCKKKYPS